MRMIFLLLYDLQFQKPIGDGRLLVRLWGVLAAEGLEVFLSDNYRGMPEKCLDAAEVPGAAQQVGGAGVPERVWRAPDVGDADLPAEVGDHLTDPAPAQASKGEHFLLLGRRLLLGLRDRCFCALEPTVSMP